MRSKKIPVNNQINNSNKANYICSVSSKSKGITLIALVITIIILLILAGVVISIIIGENGLLKTAKDSVLNYEEQQAREKLEIVLVDLQAAKVTDTNYNENDYINTRIQNEEMIVNGDIIFVDEWQFQIDRSIPQIIASLGKGTREEMIQINLTSVTTSDYVKVNMKIEITYKEALTEIMINGKSIAVPEKQDGKYRIEREILTNGTYSIIAKDAQGKYNIESITISEITEDFVIYTLQDLIEFRDKVADGRTFKGKMVEVKEDIDVNQGNYTVNNDGSITFSNNATQWTPIADETHKFEGTFEGNNHTIKGIYINNNMNNQRIIWTKQWNYKKNNSIWKY